MKASQTIRRRTTFTLIRFMIILFTGLLTVGCTGPAEGPVTQTAEPRQPFTTRSESEGGAVISWSGFTDGYQPGEETTFEVTIKNNIDQPWRGRFCLQLMAQDRAAVITTLTQQEINLEPGMGFSDSLTVKLPQSLDPGGYGLSMAVRRPAGPMVDLIPIQVGGSSEVRRAATQQDMDAALEACSAVDGEGTHTQIEGAKSDLAQQLDIEPDQIDVLSVEEKEFSDASLGVPEPGKTYAQVITPGYVIQLEVNDQTYRYHASEQKVVLVPPESTPTAPPPTATEDNRGSISIPEQGAVTTLPLHFFAQSNDPGEELKVTLRWEDGTELKDTFTTLQGPDGNGVLIDSIDWQNAGQPPRPDTDQATLVLEDQAGAVLAQQQITILPADHPQTKLIDLFWLLGEELETEQRRIIQSGSMEAAAVRELLWGPPPRNLAGFRTALPTPEEVLTYPGRTGDWDVRVNLLGLTIENGTAIVNFSKEMNAYGGGSARVSAIRQQITRTLRQFDTVDEVVISVAGETEGVLQP